MKAIKIYLAHSLTEAPPEFLERMKILRNDIRKIPGVEMLDFAWEKGPEFNERVNVYEYDMDCVHKADLLIAVLDHISSGTPMEIQARCIMFGSPLTCFHRKETRVSKIVRDCIKHYRGGLEASPATHLKAKASLLPDPVIYTEDRQIFDYAADWVKKHSDLLIAA